MEALARFAEPLDSRSTKLEVAACPLLLAAARQSGGDESLPLEPTKRDIDGCRGDVLARAGLELQDDGYTLGLAAESQDREQDLMLELTQCLALHLAF